jgi:hypothetical protein
MTSIKEVCGDKASNRGPIWGVVSAAMLLPQLIGCSGTDPNLPKVVPTSGVVSYQGKPVEGADITFNNEAAGITGTGKTDSLGRFVLSTFGDGDGVVPGRQVVAIRRVDVIDKTPPGADDMVAGPPPEIRWIIPEKYSIPTKSGLTADVSESGPNKFTFDLK